MRRKQKPKSQPKPPSREQLVEKAINYLKYRPRSRAELERYLSQKTDDQSLVSQSMEYLDELQLIDDNQFADWLARSRLNKQKGVRFISAELRRFGVSADIINSTLSALDTDDQLQSALAYLDKQASKIAKQPQRLQKPKANQLLYARGFGEHTRRAAIDEWFKPE